MQAQELLEKLSEICSHIAEGNYQQAKSIFDLRPDDATDKPVNLLIEALAMMTLRLEAREFEKQRALAAISSARHSLQQDQHSLVAENASLRARLREQFSKVHYLAHSPLSRLLIMHADQAAQISTNLLITGEPGTGKTLLARYIHAQSHRADLPLVFVNCSELTAENAESELFGQEPGINSGSHGRRGRFDQADGGTIVLEEIGDVPPEVQERLLMALDKGKITRSHERRSYSVDVRVIATSSKNLEELMEKKGFSKQLYYRLNTVRLQIAPLRDRVEDIIPLARLFLSRLLAGAPYGATRISRSAMNLLLEYNWPGNVAELAQELESAVVSASDDVLMDDDFSTRLSAKHRGAGALPARGRTEPLTPDILIEQAGFVDEASCLPLEDMEAAYIGRIMTLTRGNKSHAAAILGLSREGLRTKMNRYISSMRDQQEE
ncbi:sigma 54-interacting transcriptional regulator [Desulfovibrio sp. OttesenSCG-928-C14]|nr:sigma 54-interacting transcriptional regulator [Desulfovibrio sp. OttesenSCG-928-C14]